MKEKYFKIANKLEKLNYIPLLLLRLVLAYGFFSPAMMKWQNMNSIIEWFSGMGMPFPALNAYLAATTEAAGVILLTFGLGTRIISIPLMFVMVVAVVTVHLSNGFEASNNGFEIPLYYLLMLFVLFINGAGKLSLDYLIKRKKDNPKD